MFGTPLYRLQQAWDGRGGNREVAVLAGDVRDVSDQFPDMNKLLPGQTVMLPVADLQRLLKLESRPEPVKPVKAPTPKAKSKNRSAAAK